MEDPGPDTSELALHMERTAEIDRKIQELEGYLTQAKKSRAQLNKERGYFTQPKTPKKKVCSKCGLEDRSCVSV